MKWVGERERWVLIGLGILALVGFGVGHWQQQRPALVVESTGIPPYAQWEAMLTQAAVVDLNQASVEELRRLPGIGAIRAQRILAYRKLRGPFREATALQEVPGIGPKIYEGLREFVRVRPPAADPGAPHRAQAGAGHNSSN